MKLWIRVDAAMPRDPAIAALADQLGVELPTMIGYIVTLWGVIAEHATSGDLSAVTDATLERWAGWTKRRAKFAPAFRAQFCDEHGVLRGWAERQGALLDRKERDRQRWHARKPAETPPDSPPPLHPYSAETPRREGGDSAETPRPLRVDSASTERNGTEQRSKAKPSRPAKAGSGGLDRFPKPVCDALYNAWLANVGAVDYPRFRKALLPLHPDSGPMYSEADLTAGIVCFSEQRHAAPARERSFWNTEKFAGDVHEFVRVGKMEPVVDGVPTERLRLALAGV